MPAPRASLGVLLGALCAYSLAHLANNTLLAAPAVRDALGALQAASGGWIEPVLVRSWVVLGVFLAVVLGAGRLALADLGWRRSALVRGGATWLGAWLALNASLALWVGLRGAELALHPMLSRFGLGAVLGGILAQAAGHALAEDTAFRAFFLPQLRARAARLGPWGSAGLALFGSAALFGLAHLATRILVKSPGGAALLAEQGHFFSAGLALGLAWLASENLGVVVALHVLLNDPAPLVAVDGTTLNRAVLLVFALVLVAGFVRRRKKERAQPARAVESELERAA
ncbi:MAG: CPBP family intramembrane glutamic endopeptidase [Planctomycetota bacterium]